ncbi:hypothetical protein NitYY0814_C1832 [Nitratiruptor sp. YY08-14]|nr:hypothetical protein NitYY0810_C1824 [Nitratiruptor sp. YY08-10]BCD64975.1 hypothetical protein NitYY0814_C1832 [Nitratiruptor sp. YY08-14]
MIERTIQKSDGNSFQEVMKLKRYYLDLREQGLEKIPQPGKIEKL